MKFQLNSFGRWLIACSTATLAVWWRYDGGAAMLACLAVTAAWAIHGEVRKP